MAMAKACPMATLLQVTVTTQRLSRRRATYADCTKFCPLEEEECATWTALWLRQDAKSLIVTILMVASCDSLSAVRLFDEHHVRDCPFFLSGDWFLHLNSRTPNSSRDRSNLGADPSQSHLCRRYHKITPADLPNARVFYLKTEIATNQNPDQKGAAYDSQTQPT
jgi:hypothetical protein